MSNGSMEIEEFNDDDSMRNQSANSSGSEIYKQVQESTPDNDARVENVHDICGNRVCGSLVAAFKENVKNISSSPRDLFVLYTIAFFDSLSYYAFSYALIMHLGKEVGLTDEYAGLFYGIFGVCISISTLVLGFTMDALGIRLSICLSSAMGLVSQMGMAYAVLARSPVMTACILFFAVGPRMALMGPALPTAVKRYTTNKTKAFGFSINYGVMNLAAFIATPAVDMIRLHTQGDVLMLPPYALLIAVTALLQIPIFFAAVFGIRDLNLQEDGVTMLPLEKPETKVGIITRVKEMVHLRNFWIAVTIAISLIGVKSSFRYFDALYFPYVTRSYSDAATFPYLTLLALNPAIVIPLTITGAITLVTNKGHPIKWIIIGSFLGGIAPIFMAFGPYIIVILLYIIGTSLGEILWSPITYSYLLGLTGDGDEGAWMAIAGMPLFLAKMLTGVLTGGLLTRFCPDPQIYATAHNLTVIYSPPTAQLGGDPETCWSAVIWGIITVTTISSFFMLLAFRKFITVHQKTTTQDTRGKHVELDQQSVAGIEVYSTGTTTDDEVVVL